MPPTNESGYDVVVGPDADGQYIHVPAGEEYTQPAPPRSVTDDEADAGDIDAPAPVETPADESSQNEQQASGDQGADQQKPAQEQETPAADATKSTSGKQAATSESE